MDRCCRELQHRPDLLNSQISYTFCEAQIVIVAGDATTRGLGRMPRLNTSPRTRGLYTGSRSVASFASPIGSAGDTGSTHTEAGRRRSKLRSKSKGR
jgi:hypothetical protein